MTNENHDHTVTVMATFFHTPQTLARSFFMYQCYFVKGAYPYLENVHMLSTISLKLVPSDLASEC